MPILRTFNRSTKDFHRSNRYRIGQSRRQVVMKTIGKLKALLYNLGIALTTIGTKRIRRE